MASFGWKGLLRPSRDGGLGEGVWGFGRAFGAIYLDSIREIIRITLGPASVSAENLLAQDWGFERAVVEDALAAFGLDESEDPLTRDVSTIARALGIADATPLDGASGGPLG